ncbi:hypothetical protein N7G274_004850 [Stereocaulon virgatum]|uniref:ATP-dependent RNA helicase n=1 Tax=Stereocaulon virgatum TaxID=373712 RepID=A0ABR4ABW4_9LECA
MLNIVRRGPASSATFIFSRSFSSKCIKGARPWDVQQCVARNSHLNAIRPFGTATQWRRSATAAAKYEDQAIEAEIEQEVGAEEPPPDTQIKRPVNYGPVTEFQELAHRGMVSDTVVRTLTRDMGLKTMTTVQSLTINETLKGIDVLAQARTGTGKTIAFLLPVLQNIITVDPGLETRRRLGRKGSSTDIRAIIISPTRELAEQIAVEAQKKSHGILVSLCRLLSAVPKRGTGFAK